MYKLCVNSRFSGAHRLVDYPGACDRVHGHNWKVKACLSAEKLDKMGIVFDLIQFQKVLDESVAKFDHQFLNEVPPFDVINPTSENLARIIYNDLETKLVDFVQIESVEIFEMPDYSVIYSKN